MPESSAPPPPPQDGKGIIKNRGGFPGPLPPATAGVLSFGSPFSLAVLPWPPCGMMLLLEGLGHPPSPCPHAASPGPSGEVLYKICFDGTK